MSHVAKDQIGSITQALLNPSGCDGVYARTGLFEQIIEGLEAFVTRHRELGTEILRFPPIMSRSQIEKSGYLHNFPHLLGCVSCLQSEESVVHALVERPDWITALSATEMVLSPAACYPLYPLVAARGHLRAKELLYDVASYCFRREPTHELGRLQAFRMREFVCIGAPEQVLNFRTRWISRAETLASLLVLPYRIAPASDPFFGRAGRLAAMKQVQQSLKFELLIPLNCEEQPTACMSFNYHLDHFGTTWDLRTDQDHTAHTACVAFGLDRLALALFATHGLDLRHWPQPVREKLQV